MAGKNGKTARRDEAPAGMTRRAMYIEDSLWEHVTALRGRTVLDSNAAFVRECIRVGADRVAKKHSK